MTKQNIFAKSWKKNVRALKLRFIGMSNTSPPSLTFSIVKKNRTSYLTKKKTFLLYIWTGKAFKAGTALAPFTYKIWTVTLAGWLLSGVQ
jgi:hypothetical protein